MTPRSRSLSGAALMLMIIPLFAGLLACMPVPIGDPERSRVDPEITGVWAVLGDDESVDGALFYVFEQYDKRTWLVTGVLIEARADLDLSAYDLATYEGFIDLSAAADDGTDFVHAEEIVIYKVWLKKLGGEVFMTWEPKVVLDDGIAEPDTWLVYRVQKDDRNSFRLRMVNGEADLFDDVAKTRRAYERVVARNVSNPELYDDGSDEPPSFATLVRVRDDEMEFFEDLIGSFVGW